MSVFDRDLRSYRLAATQHGDDLQAVSARELGDANRWHELVWLNNLTHPYITTDERIAGADVLLAGEFIKVPAPVGVWTDDAERGQVYERDCALINRVLHADENGDLMVVAGSDNLRQQLQHRLDTPRGQARRHPYYGNMAPRLKGAAGRATAGLLAAEYVKSALQSDYRVASVEFTNSEVRGDSIQVTARAVAIEGGAVDFAIKV